MSRFCPYLYLLPGIVVITYSSMSNTLVMVLLAYAFLPKVTFNGIMHGLKRPKSYNMTSTVLLFSKMMYLYCLNSGATLFEKCFTDFTSTPMYNFTICIRLMKHYRHPC